MVCCMWVVQNGAYGEEVIGCICFGKIAGVIWLGWKRLCSIDFLLLGRPMSKMRLYIAGYLHPKKGEHKYPEGTGGSIQSRRLFSKLNICL